MEHIDQPGAASLSSKKKVFRLASEHIQDNAKVQLGGQGPAFRTLSITDKGKTRLGGQGPIFKR